MNTKKRIYIGLFVVLLLVSFFTVRLFVQQGQFQSIVAQSNYQCQPLKAPFGPEDLVADYDSGMLYISASPRHNQKNKWKMRGDIYSMDMTGESTKMSLISDGFATNFRPHGINLLTKADDSKMLFAINHPNKGVTTVEVFNTNSKQLEHIKTFNNVPDGLNSIVVIDENRFYATQDGHTRGISGFINAVLGLKYSEVIYYDGEKSNVVADGFVYANGIEMSADGNEVYVTDTLERTLNIYKRDKASNALTKTGDIYLGAGGDNIRRNEDGSFIIAGHPKMFSTFFHMMGLRDLAPSVVFKATPPQNGQGGELRVEHLEEGKTLSASSGAVQYKNKMFVGTVVENRMLYCVK